MDNDLNTPEGIGVMWSMIKDESVSPGDKRATLLDFDKILGLNFLNSEFSVKNLPLNVKSLLSRREQARNDKNWKKSDEIRDQIADLGYEVRDTEEGQKVTKI